jgi:hypothetical protein
VPAAVQQLDGWLGAILAIIAALGAFLVPFTGFMKEWWGYAKEVKAAEALKPSVAQQVAVTPGGGVFDSIAMADLTAAIKDLAVAIRAGTASDEAQQTSELASVMRRLTEKLDGIDEERRKGSGGWLGHR